MVITKVEIIQIRREAARRPVLCRVHTSEGIYGCGETQLARTFASDPVFEALRELSSLVIGMDPMAHEVIWEKLRRNSYWGMSGSLIFLSAISALDIALWDIKGKLCNQPLYQLLGGKQRESLRSYASQVHFGWGLDRCDPNCPKVGSPDWFYQSAKNAVDDGYDAIKIGLLFHGPAGERFGHMSTTNHLSRSVMKMAEARLAAAREAIGPDVEILLENHTNTDMNTAIELGQMAKDYDILVMEEPTAPLNPAAMLRIAESSGIRLAIGERLVSRWDFLPYFENGSLTLIQPDIGICGGITETKKIADLAQVYEVGVQMHMCTTQISYAASLHIQAAIPNFFISEHHIACEEPIILDICDKSYVPKNGYVGIPEGPGLGLSIREEALIGARIETVEENNHSYVAPIIR